MTRQTKPARASRITSRKTVEESFSSIMAFDDSNVEPQPQVEHRAHQGCVKRYPEPLDHRRHHRSYRRRVSYRFQLNTGKRLDETQDCPDQPEDDQGRGDELDVDGLARAEREDHSQEEQKGDRSEER